MKIEASTVTKLTLSDLPSLDPVALYLEDYGKGRGKLVMTCFSSSWTYYWGSMGEACTLIQFILSANNDYLVTKLLDSVSHTEIDVEATVKAAKLELIRLRREENYDKDRVRDLWDAVIQVYHIEPNLSADEYEMWDGIFGDCFWEQFCYKKSTSYEYLDRIVTQVKLGLLEYSGITVKN